MPISSGPVTPMPLDDQNKVKLMRQALMSMPGMFMAQTDASGDDLTKFDAEMTSSLS